ncbi:MAG: exopolyphosphatase [Clostridia bacterium]|nr:exopolyphosphatase [Clostridia bacterium]
MQTKKRLVTRSDFDGLACAMMLRELGLIEDIKFVHPKDVQDGKVELSRSDITTNLPYDPRVGLAFDHHESEMDRLKAEETGGKLVIDPAAKSAARVVYDYYGGKAAFPHISEELMAAVDKGDSADFTLEEILHPSGWVLLHFLMDPRTGLGRFRQFRISNYELMMELIGFCMNHTVDEILQLPDVKERVDLYFEQAELFRAQLLRIARPDGKVVVLDLRQEEIIHAGNRFLIYALFPDAAVSVHVAWGFQKQNTAVMIGKSIFHRDFDVDIGELCLSYGGGGHRNAGTCQLDNDKVDAALPTIIRALNKG